MKLFHADSSDGKQRVFSLSYNLADLIESNEEVFIYKVVDDLAKRLADDIYPDVLKAIDKDTIVKEVSTRVATEIINKLYGQNVSNMPERREQ